MTSLTLYLPKHIRVTIKESDDVVFGQALEEKESSDGIVYDLVKLLSIKPNQTDRVLRKKKGESIEKGDILAARKTLLGEKLVKAIVDGTIIAVNSTKGEVTIAPGKTEDPQVVSPVSGKVRTVDKEKITIDFNGVVVYAKQGVGSMKKGTLVILSKASEDVSISDVRDEHRQKVLLAGHVSRSVLEKAYALGAVSVVATDIDEGTMPFFEGSKLYDASIAIVAKADYEELSGYEGKVVVVEGEHKRIVIQL